MKNPAVTPLHDRVLVKQMPAHTQTAGGIVIPDTAKSQPSEGEVVAVGDGAVLENGIKKTLAVKPGDHVIFSPGSGIVVKLENEDLLIIRESDIFAKVAKRSM